jgi:hypothetical protein
VSNERRAIYVNGPREWLYWRKSPYRAYMPPMQRLPGRAGCLYACSRRLHSGLLLLLHARLARVDCANWLHVDGRICDIAARGRAPLSHIKETLLSSRQNFRSGEWLDLCLTQSICGRRKTERTLASASILENI